MVTTYRDILRANQDFINRLNVFPVPDGDTGTNMYLTARSAMIEAAKVQSPRLADVAAAAAQGSLMGALRIAQVAGCISRLLRRPRSGRSRLRHLSGAFLDTRGGSRTGLVDLST